MLDEIQREVATHLLANAMRRARIASGRRNGPVVNGGMLSGRGRSAEDEYLRGMIDLLRALHGLATADELLRAARALEHPEPVE